MSVSNLDLPLYVDVMINIYNHHTSGESVNISDVSYEVKASYSHVYNIVRLLKSKHLIIMTKLGRQRHLLLTKKGKSLVCELNKIRHIIE